MKLMTAYIWLLLCLAGCNSYSERHTQSREVTASYPRHIVVRKSLGIIWGNDKEYIDHTFTVRNNTSEDVTFLNSGSSCGCTHADIDQSTLRPGDAAPFRVSVDIDGRSGPQSFTAILKDHKNRAWEYVLEADIRRRIKIQPARSIYFDSESGESKRTNLFLASSKAIRYPIDLRARSDSSLIAVNCEHDATRPISSTQCIVPASIQLHHSDRKASGTASVEFIWRSEEGHFSESLEIRWAAFTSYLVEPKRIVFDRYDANASDAKRLRIRRTDGWPFTLVTEEIDIGVSLKNSIVTKINPDDGNERNEYIISVARLARAREANLAGSVRFIAECRNLRKKGASKECISVPIVLLGTKRSRDGH